MLLKIFQSDKWLYACYMPKPVFKLEVVGRAMALQTAVLFIEQNQHQVRTDIKINLFLYVEIMRNFFFKYS